MSNFCTNCGSPVNSSSLFCENCGAPLNQTQNNAPYGEPDRQSSFEYAPEQFQPQNIDYPSSATLPGQKPKNKKPLIIGLIAGGAVVITAVVCVLLFVLFQPKEYLLYSYTKGETEDYIMTMCNNGESIPYKLVVSGSSATIYDTKNARTAMLKFNKTDHTGVIIAADSADEKAVNVSIKENVFTITYNDETIEYIIYDPEVLKNISGDYFVTDTRVKEKSEYGEYFEDCVQSKLYLAANLHVSAGKAEAVGDLLLTDESRTKSAELNFSFDTMKGFVNGILYEYSYEVFVCADKDTIRIYGPDERTMFSFSGCGTSDLSAAAGDYAMVSLSGCDDVKETIDELYKYVGNYTDALTMTMDPDGYGQVDFSGAEYFSFSVNKDDMSGLATYSNESNESIFVTVNQDTLTMYCFTSFMIIVFERTDADEADLSNKAFPTGEFVLASDPDSYTDMVLNQFAWNQRMMPVKLTLKSDRTGKITYVDDIVFAEFTVNEDKITGKIVLDKDKSEYDLSFRFTDQDVVLSFSGGKFSYTKNPKESIEKLPHGDDYKSGKLISYTHNTSESEEFVYTSPENKIEDAPFNTIFIGSDDTDYTVILTPSNLDKNMSAIQKMKYYWKGKIDFDNMTLEISPPDISSYKDEKPIDFFVTAGDNRIKLYDTANSSVYEFSYDE